MLLAPLQLEKPKSLAEESRRHWAQISGRTYIFDVRQRDADAIAKLTVKVSPPSLPPSGRLSLRIVR